MAKVYDALRRAEAERKRRVEGDAAVLAPIEWEPEGLEAEAPAVVRDSFLKRLTSRLWRAEQGDDINKRRISLIQPESYVAEQFRALRGRIDALAAQRPIRTIAVTSAHPGEGKTTAAVNLAAVTALSLGRRVLLVDCDLRSPKVHRTLGLSPEAGLAEVLTEQANLDQAVMKAEGANLEVLAVRSTPINPSELLDSPKMRELIEELAQRYDRVILDTPAALGLPDAKAVSELCDGLVMVVRADTTPREDVRTVLEIVDRHRVLGLILNSAQLDPTRYGYIG